MATQRSAAWLKGYRTWSAKGYDMTDNELADHLGHFESCDGDYFIGAAVALDGHLDSRL